MVKIISLLHLLFWSAIAFSQSIRTVIQTGHSDRITCLQFSEDSTYLLTGSLDETIVVWDVKNQIQVNTVLGFTGGVSCFSYSSTHNILVVGTYNNVVKIFNTDSSLSEPITEYEFESYVTSVAISADGQSIAAASADYSVSLFQGEETRQLFLNDEVTGLTFGPSSVGLFMGNYDGSIYLLDTRKKNLEYGLYLLAKAEERISNIEVSQNGKYVAFGTNGYNDQPGEIGIVDIGKQKIIRAKKDYLAVLGFQPNTIDFINDKTLSYVNSENNVVTWKWKRNKSAKLTNETDAGFALSPDKLLIATINNNTVEITKTEEPTQKITLEGKAEHPIKLHAQKGDYLYVEYPSGIKKWNLAELEIEMFDEKFYESDWKKHIFSPDGSLMLRGLSIYNAESPTYSISYLDTYNDIQLAAFSTDNSRLAYLTDEGEFYISKLKVDSNQRTEYATIKSWSYDAFYAMNNIDNIAVAGDGSECALLSKSFDVFGLNDSSYKQANVNSRNSDIVLPAAYNPWDKTLLVARSKTQLDTFAYEGTEGYLKEWVSKKINRVGQTESQYINRINGLIDIWQTDSLLNKLYLIRPQEVAKNADVSALVFDTINKRLIVGYTDGTLRLLSVNNGNYNFYNYTRFYGGIKDIMLSSNSKLLFVVTPYGDITLLKNDSLTYVASLISLSDGEYVVLGKNGHYKRSKNVQNALSFQQGDAYFKLNQVDAILNKPHLVMRDLGYVRTEKIDLIERLARQKQSESDSLASGPSLEISNVNKIEYVTDKSTVSVQTICKQNNSPLAYLKIWVNGVPVYAPGNEPKATNGQEWLGKWQLDLLRGTNTIRFVVYDEAGNASQEKLLTISCNKAYVKPNLYVAVISVSEYADNTKNLKFAVKDGRDFVRVFQDKAGMKQIGFPCRFGKIYVDSFFNQDALKENILTWRNKIKKVKPEDYIMLYVSGHGLLDTAFQFWFATHDIDFDHPEQRGMSFSQLEDLLVAIPPQQKLFLMDACHSGEVLTDEIMIDTTVTMPDGSKGQLKGYTYRGTEVVDMDGESINQGELKQQLFSNYDSKSGATVISAAAGNSFALESPAWNNGIFTYTVISGLIYRLADANDNGEVSVVELSRYVTKTVKEQTGGLQIPNDRQENIENNFRVW